MAGHLLLGRAAGKAKLAELDAEAFVELVQPLDRAVEIDRRRGARAREAR